MPEKEEELSCRRVAVELNDEDGIALIEEANDLEISITTLVRAKIDRYCLRNNLPFDSIKIENIDH